MISRRWFCSLLLMLTCSSQAEQILQIRPATCVADEQGYCRVQLSMAFETDMVRVVCFDIAQQQRRWCGQAATKHALEVDVRTAESLLIEVVTPENNAVLSSAMLVVAHYQPNTSRKRRRFSWSFE